MNDEKTAKNELLLKIENLEENWNSKRRKLLEEKKELQKKVRSLEKDIEIINSGHRMEMASKNEQINLIKDLMGKKVKEWETELGTMRKERDMYKDRVRNLEGDLMLVRRDGTERFSQLKDEKEKLIGELETEHEKAILRIKDKLAAEKEEEVRRETLKIKSEIQAEMDGIIDRQKKIWKEDLEKKEKDMDRHRRELSAQLENQQIALEEREKEYLQDLLKRFKSE